MKTIKNSVLDCKTINFRLIESIQGDLKELTIKNYLKLRKNILEFGITSPIHVYKLVDARKPYAALDGTQRLRVFEKMESEGYKVPRVPIVEIDAPDLDAAKMILLSLASSYGTVTSQGLAEFIGDSKKMWDDLDKYFEFPKMREFRDQALKDHADKRIKKCPKCAHEF